MGVIRTFAISGDNIPSHAALRRITLSGSFTFRLLFEQVTPVPANSLAGLAQCDRRFDLASLDLYGKLG